MIKLVIWGCGEVGEKTYLNLRKYWKDKYQIVGFADNNVDKIYDFRRGKNIFVNNEIQSNIQGVFTPAEVLELCMNEQVDGVFIGVSQSYYADVEKQLRQLVVQKYDYIVNDLCYARDNCDYVYDIYDHKLKVYVMSNYFARFDYQNDISVIYNDDKKILYESFNWPDNCERGLRFKKPIDTEFGEELDKACMLAYDWSKNYWHFSYDVLSKIWQMEKNGFDGKYIVFESSSAKELISLLDLGEKVIWINENNSDVIYKVKELHCIQPCTAVSELLTDSVKEYSDYIVKKLECKRDSSLPKYVYFKRTGIRQLVGAEDVLEANNFNIIIPEELSIEDEIRLFYNADIIIVPHGAGVTNSMWMREGTVLIETYGDTYISRSCQPLINKKKMIYHSLIGRAFVDGMHKADDRHYSIENSLLDLTIKSARRGLGEQI